MTMACFHSIHFSCLLLLYALSARQVSLGFVIPQSPQRSRGLAAGWVSIPLLSPLRRNRRWRLGSTEQQSANEVPDVQPLVTQQDQQESTVIGVVAPLKYKGPYPCLSLRFPHLKPRTRGEDSNSDTSSKSQMDEKQFDPSVALSNQRKIARKSDHDEVVVLDFVLDTGASVNTINSNIVSDYQLPCVWSATNDIPPNVSAVAMGMGGNLPKGLASQYSLGACQLDGMPAGQDEMIFVQNLTVVGLRQACPVGHGLLGTQFLKGFFGGVEFDWHGTDGDPPTVIFYLHMPEAQLVQDNMTCLSLEPMALGQVFGLPLTIGGNGSPSTESSTTTTMSLLDTGSPATIIDPQTAQQAGIETVPLPTNITLDQISTLMKSRDDVVFARGVDGGIIPLVRSKEPVVLHAGGVSLGRGHVFVGELPGLRIMSQVDHDLNSTPPSSTATEVVDHGGKRNKVGAVLGLDSLRRTYRMVFKPQANQVWFQEL